MEKETKDVYSAPSLVELGNIVEITFGGQGGHNTDTYSTKYPPSK